MYVCIHLDVGVVSCLKAHGYHSETMVAVLLDHPSWDPLAFYLLRLDKLYLTARKNRINDTVGKLYP